MNSENFDAHCSYIQRQEKEEKFEELWEDAVVD